MVARRTAQGRGDASPLRRARLARNWTLEDVVARFDGRSPGGVSGVTPSMVSGWELGRHTTSIAHRKALCEIYGEAPEVLFTHQDEALGASGLPRLLVTYGQLREALLMTVAGAHEFLVVMGSRSRDGEYLGAIESVLHERPSLACYRVLFGPPHHQVFKDHLLRLLGLRDPDDRSLGVKTLHIGMVKDTDRVPERFFCANEEMAVVPIPSLTSFEGFDSGVVLDASSSARLIDHGRQVYAAAQKIETLEQVRELSVLREQRPRHGG